MTYALTHPFTPGRPLGTREKYSSYALAFIARFDGTQAAGESTSQVGHVDKADVRARLSARVIASW